MDDEAIATLVREAGIEDTALGATIRPDSLGETLAAPSTPPSRPLPRVSVDLRGSLRPGPMSTKMAVADLEVVRTLGEGGMGRVFLARQHSLKRDVAIKTAKDDAPDVARNAILVEGEITGSLEHPAIVPVHALGVDELGRPVMVMKRVEGVAWNALLYDPEHPGWEGWEGDAENRLHAHLQILIQISNAVHFAHSRGVVHRDIKPENVLIGRYGDVYLADWGVAAQVGTREPRLCGTPAYMAPEMVSAGVVDERTDVYLLGATLHEILAGSVRHAASSALGALLSAQRSKPHEYGVEVPVELGELANAACHLDPSARPESAKAFRDAIVRYVSHRESVALGNRAVERLAQLQALTVVEEPSPEQRREIDRLIAEARFGLEQAIAQWSANASAQEALATLDRLLESRNVRAAELERQARERDPRIGARPRAIALSLLCALGIAMAILALTSDAPTPAMLISAPSTSVTAILVSAFFYRRVILTTAVNRHAIGSIAIGLLLVIVGRIAGLAVGLDHQAHFPRDAFVLAAALAPAAIGSLRWVAWASAVYAIGGILCLIEPSEAHRIFGLTTSTALLGVAAFAWRSDRNTR